MKYIAFVSMVLLGCCSLFVVAGEFGFGINDSGGEDEAIVALHDVAVGGVEEDQEAGLVDNVVKSVVNWFLGILGLIALVVMMYGGFLMVTAGGEEDSYNKGWKILKSAVIGLLIIGLAWFVLSLIFWLIVTAGDGVGGAGSQN